MGPRAFAQAWALMEEECGNIDLARRLLQEASEKDPCDLYVWQARPPSQRPRRPAASARWTPGWLPRCCRRRLDVGTLMQLAAQRHQARSQGANAGAAAEPMRGARRPGACWRRARATCRARGSCSSRASGRSRATAASRACGRRGADPTLILLAPCVASPEAVGWVISCRRARSRGWGATLCAGSAEVLSLLGW